MATEKENLGGIRINVGCTPTKTMVAEYGVHTRPSFILILSLNRERGRLERYPLGTIFEEQPSSGAYCSETKSFQSPWILPILATQHGRAFWSAVGPASLPIWPSKKTG